MRRRRRLDGSDDWAGPPRPDDRGRLDVAGFNDYLDSHPEHATAPIVAATRFLRLDRAPAATTSVVARASAEGAGPTTVTVTLDGLFDDSVRAERFVLAFEQDADGGWRLTSAESSAALSAGARAPGVHAGSLRLAGARENRAFPGAHPTRVEGGANHHPLLPTIPANLSQVCANSVTERHQSTSGRSVRARAAGPIARRAPTTGTAAGAQPGSGRYGPRSISTSADSRAASASASSSSSPRPRAKQSVQPNVSPAP